MIYKSAVAVCLMMSCASRASAQRRQDGEFDWLRPTATSPASPDLGAARAAILKATNDFRRQHDCAPLHDNAKLHDAANYFAHFMAEHDAYSHTADKHEPWERVAMAGYDYCLMAENIAYLDASVAPSTDELAKRLVEGWEHSPEHRRNMLDADLVDIGIAVAHEAKTGKYFAVQDFGRPKSMHSQFTIRNETSQELHYTIDGQPYKLPPRYSMTHQRCRTHAPPVTLNGAPDQSVEICPLNGQQWVVREAAKGKLVADALPSP